MTERSPHPHNPGEELPIEFEHVSSPLGKVGEPGDDHIGTILRELADEEDERWMAAGRDVATEPQEAEEAPQTPRFPRMPEDATPAQLADVLRRYYDEENDPSVRHGGKARILPLGLAAIRLSKDFHAMTPAQAATALDEMQRQDAMTAAGVSDNPEPRELDWMERAAGDDRFKD